MRCSRPWKELVMEHTEREAFVKQGTRTGGLKASYQSASFEIGWFWFYYKMRYEKELFFYNIHCLMRECEDIRRKLVLVEKDK